MPKALTAYTAFPLREARADTGCRRQSVCAGTLETMETEGFFANLTTRLEEARQANLGEYQHFFAELAPRLDTARELEHELDRNLARRFNVLDYVNTYELGLSKIIANLLDPGASHGQGTLFLQMLMAKLKEMEHARPWPDPDRSQISVSIERVTDNRRIDVFVEIVRDREGHCLAIENKPFAPDREDQVKDYLVYLKKEYCERFLLIYLSPTGEGPSESSISKEELSQWKGHFAIMPYHRGQEKQGYGGREERDEGNQEKQGDEFSPFRVPYSLSDWFGACRKNCEVDRLRWFLRDAELFCQRRFGGQDMTTDSETSTVRDFLLKNPSNLKIAQAVYESWPAVKEHVCGRFLEQVCSRIKQKVKQIDSLKDFVGDGMRIGCRYGGEAKSNQIWLYRVCWAQYETEEQPISDRRTTILLDTDKKGPNGWFIGVSSPLRAESMADEDKERRQSLDKELKLKFPRGTHSSKWRWPWWEWVDNDKKNWNGLIKELHQECEAEGDGEITQYFVDKFVKIAVIAIPIINKIESC